MDLREPSGAHNHCSRENVDDIAKEFEMIIYYRRAV